VRAQLENERYPLIAEQSSCHENPVTAIDIEDRTQTRLQTCLGQAPHSAAMVAPHGRALQLPQ